MVLHDLGIPSTIFEVCVFQALKERRNSAEIRESLCISRSEIVRDAAAIDILQSADDESALGDFF